MDRITIVAWLERHLEWLLLLAMTIVAILTFEKYGVGWDEPMQRDKGFVSYDYVFSGDTTLLGFFDRPYGVVFELPLVIIEKVFNLTDTRDIYMMRHFIAHLFFLLGALFCFRLTYRIYESNWLAAIAFLLFALHPVLHGHSFFNTKDIPFMAMFMISLYQSAIALESRTVKSVLVLGICIGLLINLRLMGVILLVALVVILLIQGIAESRFAHHRKLVLIIVLTSAAVLYITWPYLWADPIDRFFFSLKSMAHIWWDLPVLFNGYLVSSADLPWYYVPQWFAMTTPVLWLVAGLCGIVMASIRVAKSHRVILRDKMAMNNALFLICFLGPIIAVIAIRSVLYDGWRHMFFIYPAFVMLVVYALNVVRSRLRKQVFTAIALIFFLPVIVFGIRNFPNEHVYFNEVMLLSKPEYVRTHFEMDYWGVSGRQALEYILQHDTSRSIAISAEHYLGQTSYDILPLRHRERIRFTPREEADYFMTNYRWHPQDYSELAGRSVYSIRVGKNTIFEVFRLE